MDLPYSDQALDFTAAAMKKPIVENSECPVLDLSYKKQEPPARRYEEEAQSSGVMSPLSNNSMEANYRREHESTAVNYSDNEMTSPFEGRTFMMTPPSESDSPKKAKYEPVYSKINRNNSSESLNKGNSPLPMRRASFVTVLPSTHSEDKSSGDETIEHPVSTSATVHSPTSQQITSPMTSPEIGKKSATTRPFKAYPKDPLSLTVGSPEVINDRTSNDAYTEFRKRMLESVRKTNEGTNIKMRRVSSKSPGLPTSTIDDKDAAYWERRRKNNEAAKRSRDARRAKEDEIAIRAAFLEQENIKLKFEVAALKNEAAKLRCLIYSTG